MKRWNSYIEVSIIIFIVFILTSCKTKFKFISHDTEELKINKLLTNIQSNYLEYDNLSIKFQVKLKRENSRHVIHGMYRIKKDSIIWLTMGPSVGFEIMRAVLVKDSLKFINRFDKTYYIGSYDYIEKLTKMNFNYEIIENILTNKLLFTEKEKEIWQQYISRNYYYSIIDNKYQLKIKESIEDFDSEDLLIQTLEKIVVLPNVYKVEELAWNDKELERNMNIRFSEFKKLKDNYFPNNINIEIYDMEDTILVDLKLKQISIDKKIKYPFKIPKRKYEQVQ